MRFKKAEWINSTNVYEVNVRQYTAEGTFAAFAKELPRLKDMGVETLWFMPVTPISKKNMKGTMGSYYACSDYISINPEFGTLDDFKMLVKQAQAMGFKVIIDWVANHTGWDHTWTQTHPEFYKKDIDTNDHKIASGMDDIIELDFHNHELRKAMIDAMRFWVEECGIDGFRCDLAFWVPLAFWLEARIVLDKIKTLFWLAELEPIDHSDYYLAFDACYTWKWMHETEEFSKGKFTLNDLTYLLKRYNEVSGNTGIPLWFTSNHDENSWNGTEYEKYGDMAKALAVFSATWNGMPMIYNGQEMPNLKRLAFFDKDVIEWDGKYELHDFYRTLLTLHKNNIALRAADAAVTTYLIETDAPDNVMAYLRKNGDTEVLTILNFSKENVALEIDNSMLGKKYKNVFNGSEADLTEANKTTLAPWEYLVYESV